MSLNDGASRASPPPSPEERVEQSARFEFPKMLYKMLDDCTFDERYCKIISWQPHGMAFKVHNIEELESILPQWFREKYESFRCLLEQWGFLKLARGKDRGCWYHKKFYYHRSGSSDSKNRYENIEKGDFIQGMPEYLSFRDEPDLEKESTEENRIPPLKKQNMMNLLLEKDVKTKKVASRLAKKRKRMTEKTDVDASEKSDYYDDESDLSDNAEGLVKCRYCKKYYSKFGVKKHEMACMRLHEGTTGPFEDSSRILKSSENAKTERGSVLSDDTSVDSVESGCRICGFDDDHANLLLCEGCDTEVHTFCLNPPLEKVPTGDWFCDSCKLRMGKAEEEFGSLLRSVPPEMAERFGEICFAKSAENAHWWPALIFDPRSFLHNREVVDLARRNLGKRYLVFFFENQDAFAAIPKRWIMTWDQAVEKEFDKGKSVKHASKSRKLQFQRAMDLAKEAFEGVSSGDSDSDEMNFDAPADSDIEEDSISPRIPRVIGGSSTSFGLRSDFHWKQIRDEVRREVASASPSDYPEVAEKELPQNIIQRVSGKWQVQVYMGGKKLYLGMFPDQHLAAFAANLFQEKVKAVTEAFDKGDTLAPPTGLRSSRRRDKTTTDFTPDSIGSSPKPAIVFGTFTDKKPIGRRSRSAAKAKNKTKPISTSDRVLRPKPPPPPPPPPPEPQEQPPPKQAAKKVDSLEKPPPPPQPPPPLSDHERNDLLLKTPFCHYYLLPLSQL